MIVDLSNLDMKNSPVFILKNQSGDVIAPLLSAMNIKGQLCYNEISEVTFEIPKFYNGIEVEAYDEVCGMRIVEWKNIGQFILTNPVTKDNGIYEKKECKLYSLEHEFTYKQISLDNGTYEFWNPVSQNSSILGIILSSMPSWSPGEIDSNLIGKYRTFEIDNENLYDFMKSTLQETYNCIFEFDTFNRIVNVRDAGKSANQKPVYLSTENLAKEIEIEENTENIITVLDVNGADGVNIRSVNPLGTNKIYNLDYFMKESNFSSDFINKWQNWKDTFKANQQVYHNIVMNQTMQTERYRTENATLTTIQNVLTKLEQNQAIIIQNIAKDSSQKSDLDDINKQIKEQKQKISQQQNLLTNIKTEIATLSEQLKKINQKTQFSAFFSDEEIVLLDRYFKEDAITNSSFVTKTDKDYTEKGTGYSLGSVDLLITEADVIEGKYSEEKTFYDIRGGKISFANTDLSFNANIVRGTLEYNTDRAIVFSCFFKEGHFQDEELVSGGISLTSIARIANKTDSLLHLELQSANVYLTKNTTNYEQQQVQWELYEYGIEQLKKFSSPLYSFKISLENFFALDSYRSFSNQIMLGNKVYLKTNMGVITPIAVCVNFDFNDIKSIEIEFGSTFDINNATFDLSDLVSQSVSMGKSVDFNKYNYNRFIDSGAETSVRDFMNAALDVAKNAILSSSGQAVSWDGSGLRLRKWINEEEKTYDPKQIWMANNSIMFTKDNWENAVIGIGEFQDKNLGSCYGIVAPNIVGTLLAGENLLIESVKKDGGISVFRVDGNGAFLHNADFNVVSNGTHISLNAEHGIGIGGYPLYTTDEDGKEILNEDNAKFWVDSDGNIHFKGKLEGCNGLFTGSLEVGGKAALRVDSIGNLRIGGTEDNPNFMVDCNGNVTAKNGLFEGVINAKDFQINGEAALDGNKIKNDFLDLGNITLDGKTGDITLGGNIYISGNIQWNTNSSPVKVLYARTELSQPSGSYMSYPSSSSSNWHRTFNAKDYFASYSYDGGVTWSVVARIQGENGTDAAVTDEAIFNILTDNGTKFGVFSNENGEIFINARFIKTGTLDADRISLEGSVGGFCAGYGAASSLQLTEGAMMYGGSGLKKGIYIIATNAGCRLAAGNTQIYASESNATMEAGGNTLALTSEGLKYNGKILNLSSLIK